VIGGTTSAAATIGPFGSKRCPQPFEGAHQQGIDG
jgi:hypothetical protein